MIFTRDEGGRQDHATLVLGGEIDVATAPALRHVADNLPLAELRRLTVDLADVPFMDSTGVAFLVSLRKRMPVDSEIVVVHAQPIVGRVLQLSGLGTVMELVFAPPVSTEATTRLDATG
ncbi:MAG: STAS domain-containing protein [Actinomycetota bacterium]|nr:STAS domain-containing protein [Actinomycetota bacterium]